jgi:hypothetical protein
MKNVEKVGRGGMYRVPLENAPPLRGWAIRYVSGMEGEEEVEPGFYLAYWYPDGKYANFAFEPNLHGVFKDENEAMFVAEQLRLSEIITEVERIN